MDISYIHIDELIFGYILAYIHTIGGYVHRHIHGHIHGPWTMAHGPWSISMNHDSLIWLCVYTSRHSSNHASVLGGYWFTKVAVAVAATSSQLATKHVATVLCIKACLRHRRHHLLRGQLGTCHKVWDNYYI